MKMKHILDALQPPAIIVGEDYRIEYANRSFGELCGIEVERLVGGKCHSVCHGSETPCRLNGSPCPLKEVFSTGRAFIVKHVHKCRDGEERVFEVQASPIISPRTGRVERMLEIMVETEEEIEGVRRLQSAEEFLHAVLEGIGEGVVVISGDLRIIRANEEYLKMSGMSADEIKGEHCYRASHGYDRPCFEKGEDCPVVRTFRTGIRHSSTHVHHDNQGRPIYVELNAFPLRDYKNGQIVAVLETINDVSDKVALREKLKSSEGRYRDLYNRTPVMLFNMNEEGIITECNQTMADKLGINKDALKGRLFTSLLSADSRESFDKKRQLCEVEDICLLEVEMLDDRGNPIPIRLTGKKVPEQKGVYYSIIGQDLSELKKAEEEKRLLEAQLLQAQKMESIGTLSAGIAHDFNNILTGLMGYTELLERLQSSSQGKDYLARINELLNIASNLTKQLLIVGRRAEAEYQVFDLNTFLDEFVSTIKRIIGDNIVIEQDITPSPITIKGDTSQIYQMLMNLFVNARDAMPDGGTIHLGLSRTGAGDSGAWSYHHAEAPEYALITIRDTGTGIPEAIRERIFDPFFTTKTDRTNKGTGLGLSVVYSIVTAHKGKIEVESTEGRGTEFRIYLPVSREEGLEQKEEAGEEIRPPERESTIMVVDDEEIIRDVVQSVLEDAGMNVLTARNGQEAIEIFRDHEGKIDLVILDKSMPGIDGIETFRRLREIDPGLKAVLSSGYSHEKKNEFLEMGFAGYLKKPYKLQDILLTVQECIGN